MAEVEHPQLTIPDLPTALRVVPPEAVSERDPEQPAKRAAWEAWRDGVARYRMQRRIATDPTKVGEEQAALQQLVERARCTRDSAYFVAVWCSIYEARDDEDHTPGWKPAIPYPFQVRFLRWRDERMAAPRRTRGGFISKARDMGATWYLLFGALHGFLFKQAYVAKLVSRMEAMVDNGADVDAMFGRIAGQFDAERNPDHHLPAFLMPAGFEFGKHRTHLKLLRPDNSNAINGEATTKRTGRGGRCTEAIEDELAFWDDAEETHGTLGATAGCQFGNSSESVEISDAFSRMVSAAKMRAPETVFEMDWWLHPERNQEWLENERNSPAYASNPEKFAREVLRQPYAGFGGWAYPQSREMETGHFPYQPGQPVWIAIDPGFDDETAIHWLSRDEFTGRYRVIRSFTDARKPPEYYADLIWGHDDPESPTNPAIAEWVRSILPPQFVYGDPAGSQKHAGDSFYDKMHLRWAELSRQSGRKGLAVTYSWLQDDRRFQGRRMALMELLPNMDFHNDNGVPETLRALQESRWDDNPNRQAEQKVLRHDQFSHRRSSLEYFAVNRRTLEVNVAKKLPKPYSARKRAA